MEEFDVSCEWFKFRRQQTIKQWKIKQYSVQCTQELSNSDGRISARELELKFISNLFLLVGSPAISSDAVIFGMFASRIFQLNLFFGVFQLRKVRVWNQKQVTMMKHMEHPHTLWIWSTFFGVKKIEVPRVGNSALETLHFVRASSKTKWKSWREWDVKCYSYRFLEFVAWVEATNQAFFAKDFVNHLDSVSSHFSKESCGTVLWNLRCSLRCRSPIGSSCDCVCVCVRFPSGRKGKMKSLKKDLVTRRFKSQQEAVFVSF